MINKYLLALIFYFLFPDEKKVARTENWIEKHILNAAEDISYFDIDRTLTDTKNIDDKCFIAAFQDEFNVVLKNTEWSVF